MNNEEITLSDDLDGPAEYKKGDLKVIQTLNPPESPEVIELPLLEGVASHILHLDFEIWATERSLRSLKALKEHALCEVIQHMGKRSDAQLGPYRLIRKKVYRSGYEVQATSYEQIKIIDTNKEEE